MTSRTRQPKTDSRKPGHSGARVPNVSTPPAVAQERRRRPAESPVAQPQYVGLRTLWFAGDPADSLTPASLMSLVDLAERGCVRDLVRVMHTMEKRDPVIGAHMQTRRSGVLACGIEIQPDEDAAERGAAQEACDLVKEQLARLDVQFPLGGEAAADVGRTAGAATEKQAASATRPTSDPSNTTNYPMADPLRAPLDGQPGEIAFTQSWRTSLMIALDAIGKEFSVQEMLWDTSGSEWRVAQLAWRPQWWFQFWGFNLRLRDLSVQGLPLNPLNFFVHRQQALVGIPGTSGLMGQLIRPYIVKNYSVKDLVSFQELFGQPLRIGTYTDGMLDEQKSEIWQALHSLGTNACALIREGSNIEVKDNARGAAGASTIFERTIDLMDKWITLAILGQLSSIEKGGSFAKAQVLDRIRFDLLDSDASSLEASLRNGLFAPIVRMNLGAVPIPKAVIPRREPLDVLGTLKSFALGASMGMRIGRRWAGQQVGWPEPDDGEDVLSAPPAVP